MGKIRVKTFGDEEQEKKQQEKEAKRKEAKKAQKMAEREAEVKEKQDLKPGSDAVPGTHEVEKVDSVKQKVEKVEEKAKKKEKFTKEPTSTRSQNYRAAVKLVDRTKMYDLSEAVKLLEQLKRAKFDETVELHINTLEKGISGSITLPHGTGKKTRVVIADDAVIADIEKGKIEFDILLAQPQMMPKLAKVARVLGPRGLMPNPKNGTVTANPQDVAKKYEGGQMNFKTEAKEPIIHLTVGKVSFGDAKLTENIKVAINAVQTKNIRNITLKSTMSPGIKIATTSV